MPRSPASLFSRRLNRTRSRYSSTAPSFALSRVNL
jgi:hypothetical protein